jgi:hypothetical protein
MSKHLGNHRGIFNRGDDFQGAATVRAMFDVDIEYPFTKAVPDFRPLGPAFDFQNSSRRFCESFAQLMREEVERHAPLPE